MKSKIIILFLYLILLLNSSLFAQTDTLSIKVKQVMLNATEYLVNNASNNGGYVWYYLPDFSRRWGELEAYKTQIWLQGPGGTIDMGNLFLDAFNATGNEFYYRAAEEVADALIWGQLPCGGWNYFIDFGGNRSAKLWYSTIGENAWGFEEFYHYYGNATFDDGVSAGAANFLLRIYIQKLDNKFKPSLDKAIDFITKSQYPLGGWPQRFPLKFDYPHGFSKDYTSFYTFNDEVIENNIGFLLKCYILLGNKEMLDPIRRGMNFYLITQQGNPQAAWGQQYNMELEPAHARTFEPPALLPGYTFHNCMLLLEFYKYTGDRKFLARIPDAIQWLKSTQLPDNETDNGKYTHPTFIEVGTNRALFTHRSGTNVRNGHYWWNYRDTNPVLHYGEKTNLNINLLENKFNELNSIPSKEIVQNSPLKSNNLGENVSPQEYYKVHPYFLKIMNLQLISRTSRSWDRVKKGEVKKIMGSLDKQNRWTVQHIQISRPYSVSNTGIPSNTAKLSTNQGASIVDSSDQKYLSTREYIKNMEILIHYLKEHNK